MTFTGSCWYAHTVYRLNLYVGPKWCTCMMTPGPCSSPRSPSQLLPSQGAAALPQLPASLLSASRHMPAASIMPNGAYGACIHSKAAIVRLNTHILAQKTVSCQEDVSVGQFTCQRRSLPQCSASSTKIVSAVMVGKDLPLSSFSADQTSCQNCLGPRLTRVHRSSHTSSSTKVLDTLRSSLAISVHSLERWCA